jgi:hypothetical protein
MLLESKNAVIYGAGGAILAGRTLESIKVAKQIRSAGREAGTAQIDESAHTPDFPSSDQRRLP